MADRGQPTLSLQNELRSLQSKYADTLTREQALNYAIESAELHMKFLRLATSRTEKAELGNKCKALLTQAEKIKNSEHWNSDEDLLGSFRPIDVTRSTNNQYIGNSFSDVIQPVSLHGTRDSQLSNTVPSTNGSEPISTRPLSNQERSILLKSAKLNGLIFPSFQDTPNITTSIQFSEKEQYEDPTELRMSKTQLAIFDDWKRPSEALPPPSWPTKATANSVAYVDSPDACMKATQVVDLVQDAATDCSIVASLSASIARTEHGFPEILSTAIHPFDLHARHPRVSANGKYLVRLNFNGCYRQVIIDDRLPVSKTSRVLHVVDRNNPYLLWPALLEKAYLKVRGGYDFPGSNSGTDLWVLSGWIPEQIFLQSSELDVDKLWSRVFKAFAYGDVLITLGTGVMTSSSEKALGLAGEHDYAVTELDESEGRQRVLIKNPWLQATAWKDYHSTPEKIEKLCGSIGSGHDESQSGVVAIDTHGAPNTAGVPTTKLKQQALSPGMFWMDVSNVMQNFESIYLNWNPSLFKFRQDFHFEWDLTPGSITGRSYLPSIIKNPQLSVKCSKKDNVWLLLSRHFSTNDCDKAKTGIQGFISLYAFENNGKRCILSRGAVKQTPYVDSPQTLLTLEVMPETSYTIAVTEQDLHASLHMFTLLAFSRAPLTLGLAAPRFPQQSLVHSSWKHTNSGGNASSIRYSQNPQFGLLLSGPSSLCMILETSTPGLSVHAKLLHGQGQRIFSVTNKDIILDTGDYQRGCAIVETRTAIPAGTYTIICSTFDPGQLGDFTLRIESDVKATLHPIAREGAGRVRDRLSDASFPSGVRAIAAPIAPKRLASVNFTARFIPSLVSSSMQRRDGHSEIIAHSPLRLTLELGRGPTREIVIASGQGAFKDDPNGVRTDDATLHPGMTQRQDLWLVLERLGIFDELNSPEERVAVDMFADIADAAHFGVWRNWDR